MPKATGKSHTPLDDLDVARRQVDQQWHDDAASVAAGMSQELDLFEAVTNSDAYAPYLDRAVRRASDVFLDHEGLNSDDQAHDASRQIRAALSPALQRVFDKRDEWEAWRLGRIEEAAFRLGFALAKRL